MEAGPKSPAVAETSDEFDGLLTEQDDAVLELSPEIPIKEEKVEEFMQELYRELHSAAPAYETSFRAGNVKSESCGASVSPSASTVMAGIEFAGGIAGSALDTGGGHWWGDGGNGYYLYKRQVPSDSGGDHDVDHQKKRFGKAIIDGCDLDEELDDEWLARVLSWGPVELDPLF